jgi:5'-nucleotidase
VANIDDSLEPSFQGKYNNSMILSIAGRSVGVVGVTTTMRSNWGNVNILPEVEAVQREVQRLTEDGIKIIIVLSHCGLEVDRQIAKHGGPIDIIVGGHSHSFLYSGLNPPSTENPVGDYPIIEDQENGHQVLIVQAFAYTKYLGDITLYFDDEGNVKNYFGAPIYLDHNVPMDPAIVAALQPWKEEIDHLQNRIVGLLEYDVSSSGCYSRECGMGDLTADAYDYAVRFKFQMPKLKILNFI